MCGVNTGFYLTLLQGSTFFRGLMVCTANVNSQRDPITITVEGSNSASAALTLGSSWTLLYNGPSGLAVDPGRSTCGPIQYFTSNMGSYASYRFLVTAKRGADSSTSYSEIKFVL